MATALPKGYEPSEKEDYMNPQQLAYFEAKLNVWKQELIEDSQGTINHLMEENWHQPDIADRASLEMEVGVDTRKSNRYLKLIAKIDEALGRIHNGEYGYCEDTGEPIGLKRLMARPTATRTVEAQERYERMEEQYNDDD